MRSEKAIESPEEWREIDNHVVFAFNDPNNWDSDGNL